MLFNSKDFLNLSLENYDPLDLDNEEEYIKNYRIHRSFTNNSGFYFIVDKIEGAIISFQYDTNKSNFDYDNLDKIYDEYLKPYFIRYDNVYLLFDIPDDVIFYLKLKGLL